jgi:hypothetical protein
VEIRVGTCVEGGVEVEVWAGGKVGVTGSIAVAVKVAVGKLATWELQLPKTSARIEFMTKCLNQDFAIS